MRFSVKKRILRGVGLEDKKKSGVQKPLNKRGVTENP
jgi:hypothetical protein